jgi:hypothetical protein
MEISAARRQKSPDVAPAERAADLGSSAQAVGLRAPDQTPIEAEAAL